MIEQFNRINKAFGANLVDLLEIRVHQNRIHQIEFHIEGFGDFSIEFDGSIMEITRTGLMGTGEAYRFESPNSRVVQAISNGGGERDDNGNMILA